MLKAPGLIDHENSIVSQKLLEKFTEARLNNDQLETVGIEKDVTHETHHNLPQPAPDPTEMNKKSTAPVENGIVPPAMQRLKLKGDKSRKPRKINGKLVAIKYDDKGTSIYDDSDEDDEEEEVVKEKPGCKHDVEKEKPARQRLMLNKIQDSRENETVTLKIDDLIDPENEASNDEEGDDDDDDEDESDGIPVITIPLGDILKKYARQLRARDNSKYEYEYDDDSKDIVIREFEDNHVDRDVLDNFIKEL